MQLFDPEKLNLYRFMKMNVFSSNEILDYSEIKSLIKRYIGLHTARVGKAFISLLNKGINRNTIQLNNDLNFDEAIIQKRCMRQTLHLINIDDLEMLHYATKKIRMPKLNINNNQLYLQKSQDVISEFLDKDYKNINEIYTEISKKCKIDIETSRLLLKYHYENGLIFFKNMSKDPYKEIRRYGLLKNKNIDITKDKEEQGYINALVLRYIKAFGPVSMQDITWWSGISGGKIIKALDINKDQITKIRMKNSNVEMHVSTDEIYLIYAISDKNNKDWCKFMAYEDASLKAYYQTRMLFVDNPQKYFNSIGEIYATILLNGKCVGIWNPDIKNEIINISHLDCDKKYYNIINEEKSRMEKLLFPNQQMRFA